MWTAEAIRAYEKDNDADRVVNGLLHGEADLSADEVGYWKTGRNKWAHCPDCDGTPCICETRFSMAKGRFLSPKREQEAVLDLAEELTERGVIDAEEAWMMAFPIKAKT